LLADYGYEREGTLSQFDASQWHIHAANCAQTTRKVALELLEELSNEDNREKFSHPKRRRKKAGKFIESDGTAEIIEMRELVESLLLNHVTSVTLEIDELPRTGDGDNLDGTVASPGRDKDRRWSASSVEAASRYRAAILLSGSRCHDEARQQLQLFYVSYRIHPAVWDYQLDSASSTSSETAESISNNPVLFRRTQLEPPSATNGGNFLPPYLYQRLLEVFAPDADYWVESRYSSRGYISFYHDLPPSPQAKPPTSHLIEDIVLNYLLPAVQSRDSSLPRICGYEWWVQTRPGVSDRGQKLHFNVDRTGLVPANVTMHPICSSVLYLTGSSRAGATVCFDQTPESTQVAAKCWKNRPADNTLLVFFGNLLHGGLPSQGKHDEHDAEKEPLSGAPDATVLWKKPASESDTDKDSSPGSREEPPHILKLMVGFWTRRVTEDMDLHDISDLYGPCGILPPRDDDEHTWVEELYEGYGNGANDKIPLGFDSTTLEAVRVPAISPAWDKLSVPSHNGSNVDPSPLRLPHGMDHRFFVHDALKIFKENLFE
jgi:hypothetical protein